MIEELNKSFKRISRKLFSRSLNYYADFKLYQCEGMAGESLNTVATAALGDRARVGGSGLATKEEVIEDLRSALHFEGDDGAHPNIDYLKKPENQKDFEAVISLVHAILDDSGLIVRFWLEDGHRFYPVFWDFAFLIETAEDSILFIASSSD